MKNKHPRHRALQHLATTGLVVALMIGGEASAAPHAHAKRTKAKISTAQLMEKLDAVIEQNRLLQGKVEKLEAEQARQSAMAKAQSNQLQQQATQLQTQAAEVSEQKQEVAEVRAGREPAAGNSSLAGLVENTSVGGYGEINYSRPDKSPKDAYADVSRAVIGITHRFDPKTKLISEFEWEHAIVSSGDSGEAEVEQLWIERELTPILRARGGLFLMPVGLINENHEPTAFYGVFRPEVDTKIVPSTWREIGLGLTGDAPHGLAWKLAVTTAPNLSKWAADSTEGRERGPLQATHGEGQYAAARDGGVVGALNWRGMPGLLLGGSVFYAGIGQHQPDSLVRNSNLLLLDAHARWQYRGLDLAGEYIHGTITGTEAQNEAYSASAIAAPTLIPHEFYGGYLQAAYQLFRFADYRFSPFVRYSILNTAADFGDLSVAAGGIAQHDERIWTWGANFNIGQSVVLKADYRLYSQRKLPDPPDHFNLGNSINLGLGFSF